jgi:predicted Zn-dependent peptidase
MNRQWIPIPEEKVYPEWDTDKNRVLFCDYDMVQAQIILLSRDRIFDSSELPQITMFNNYYGGVSSIVFQEMREATGLAYSAFAGYRTPDEKDKSNYVYAYIATQPDKIKIAMDRFKRLLEEMPKSEMTFENSRKAIVKQINTERIIKDQIFWTYLQNKDRGIDRDYREEVYREVREFNLDDLNAFFEERIRGHKYDMLVLGNRNNIDFNVLGDYGEVKELSLEELFNY